MGYSPIIQKTIQYNHRGIFLSHIFSVNVKIIYLYLKNYEVQICIYTYYC